jgi:hypothetical protein
MGGLDLLMCVAGAAIICLSSLLACFAQEALWKKCRRRSQCLQDQRLITLGKSHSR